MTTFAYTQNNDQSALHEAVPPYYGKQDDSVAARVDLIRRGIPFAMFKQVREESPFSLEEWAVFLDISLKSLQRYIKDTSHVFKASHTEKIIEIGEVLSLGHEVFGDLDKFYTWCTRENLTLGGHTPLDLIRDSYGKQWVMDELHRIDHGVFA